MKLVLLMPEYLINHLKYGDVPGLDHGKWNYKIEKLKQTTGDCFPDEPYDVAKDDAIFLGAYDGNTCIGLAVLRKEMFRYLFL